MKASKWYLGMIMGTLATGMLVNQAEAVPSFARQTGLAASRTRRPRRGPARSLGRGQRAG